jgi:GR25 family glycosyltransferase involved in LPS biosynthesis
VAEIRKGGDLKKQIKPYKLATVYDPDILPVALISLEDEGGRRATLVKNGIPISWSNHHFKAVRINEEEQQFKDIINMEKMAKLKGDKIFAGEIGCAYSHRCVAQWLATSPFELMLIVEDDIVPCCSNYENKVINIANSFQKLAQRGQSFMVHLGLPNRLDKGSYARPVYFSSSFRKDMPYSISMHIGDDRTIWYAHAYLLSKQAAINAINIEKKLMTLADDWVSRRHLGLLDKIFYCHPRIFEQNLSLYSCIGVRTSGIPPKEKSSTQKYANSIYHSIVAGSFFSKIHNRLLSYIPVYIK